MVIGGAVFADCGLDGGGDFIGRVVQDRGQAGQREMRQAVGLDQGEHLTRQSPAGDDKGFPGAKLRKAPLAQGLVTDVIGRGHGAQAFGWRAAIRRFAVSTAIAASSQ